MLDAVLNFIFPPRCAACGALEEQTPPLCAACAQSVELHGALACGECRARLPENRKVCHKDFPYLLGAAADYDIPALKNLILALKFQNIRAAGRPLADFLIRYYAGLGQMNFAPDLVLPVPLGARRARTRGYNQAALIGEAFAAHFGLPYNGALLVRAKETEPQTDLPFERRQLNLIGAFRVNNPELVRGRSVVIVDDVTTSGATFRAAAEALKEAGARSILALAVAEA